MAAMDVDPPVTTQLLFNLKDLGIDLKYIFNRVTMESEKYICFRETNRVVVIDMTQPTQPIRLPITVDYATMNPDTPILAFKVEAKRDGATEDQLHLFDVKTKYTLKSYNIAEKVELVKWISPKLLGVVTLKAIYHWSIQGSEEPVKMFDITDVVATSKITKIWNYMLESSQKWVVLMGYKKENNKTDHPVFVRRYQGGDQWFSNFSATAVAFTTFNFEGNDTTSTLLCSAIGRIRSDTGFIELNASDGLDSQQGKPNFKKKNLECNIAGTFVRALQISQKYGLIYVITERGLVSIHDLETLEAVCSYNIVDHITDDNQIWCTTEGPSSGSFYAINWKGQVLLASVNDSTILSYVSDKLISTGKLHDLQKLCLQILKEKEETVTNLEKSLKAEIKKKEELNNINEWERQRIQGLTKQNTELTKHNIVLTESLKAEQNARREIENQLTAKMAGTDNYQKSQEEMTNMLQTELKTENAELQSEIKQLTGTLIRIEGLIKQNTEFITQNTVLAESLKVEQNARRETEEQLRAKMTEIDNCQKTQEEMMKKMEYFQLLKEANTPEANFTEYTRAELKEVTYGFSNLLKIGEGGYGPVYKAFLGLKPVAIKILKFENRHGNEQFNQEVDILSKIRHPNLVMLLGACQEAQALVYELMPNGSLYDMLRNKQTANALTANRRISIAFNICSALIFLHSAKPHGIVHGDLKSANILLDSKYMGKLSDFGICRQLQKIDSRDTEFHITHTLKGTRAYIDPECFSLGEMTAQYDVYSFGIILLELVTGGDPNGLRDEVKQAFKTGKIFVDASAGEWPLVEARKMVHLGLRCSEFSRKERPNLEKEVLPEIESMLRASLHF